MMSASATCGGDATRVRRIALLIGATARPRAARRGSGPRDPPLTSTAVEGPRWPAMSTGIITGASRGLGLELTRALAAQGWMLVVDARDAAALSEATRDLDGVL